MRNRALRALLLGTALGGLALGASGPAQAATLAWEDPAGDATDLGVGVDLLPNDAAFDIVKVAVNNDGGVFKYEAEIPGLVAGAPTVSTGYYFRLSFSHGGAAYSFIVGDDVTGATAFSLGTVATPRVAIGCKDCKGEINREAKKVIVTAPVASMSAGFKAAEAPAVEGSEFSTFEVVSQRRMVASTLTADTATAPEGSVLAF